MTEHAPNNLDIKEISLLKHSNTSDSPAASARRNISSLLDELAERAELELPVEVFKVTNIHRLYQLSALAIVSKEERLSFVKDVCEIDIKLNSLTPRSKSFLEKMFRHLTLDEKKEICRWLLRGDSERGWIGLEKIRDLGLLADNKAACQLLSCCLCSTQYYHQIESLARKIGIDTIAEHGTYRTKCLASLIRTQKIISKLAPKDEALGARVPRAKLRDKLNSLKDHLITCKKVLEVTSDKKMPAFKRYKHIFDKNLELINKYKGFLSQIARQNGREKQKSLKIAREAISALPKKITFELKHCISLEIESSGKLGATNYHWRPSELLELELAFKEPIQRYLVGAQLFFRIILSRDLKSENHDTDKADGCRTNQGVIKLHINTSERSVRDSVFNEVLMHELGHQVYYGKFGGEVNVIDKDHDIEALTKITESTIDVKDFFKLTGWRAVPSADWETVKSGNAIKIGDRTYPYRVPVDYNGEMVMFFDYETYHLYYHPISTRFNDLLDNYYSPYEHYAESFSKYFTRPYDLIEEDPLLFIHYEQQFGKFKLNNKFTNGIYQKLIETLPELNNDRYFQHLAGKISVFRDAKVQDLTQELL